MAGNLLDSHTNRSLSLSRYTLDTMLTQFSAQEILDQYVSLYCDFAAFALLVYDWLLCFSQETRLIWNWRSKVPGPCLVYALSRYAILISKLLSVLTIYPTSNSSCTTLGWTLIVVTILGTVSFSAFSALRAYALSDRNVWLAGIILILALPPPAMSIIQAINSKFRNLDSPFNCTALSLLSPALATSVNLVSRASQLAAELLVVIITWWYTYQSYQLWKDGIKFGRSLSSLLVYNGSIYFLFFATWYILDIILNTAPVSPEVLNVDNLLVTTFYDPVSSILICRFILSLRQFDSKTASTTCSDICSSRIREHLVTSPVLEFAARPSDTLPSFIASFSHPVHMDSEPEVDMDLPLGDASEWREIAERR